MGRFGCMQNRYPLIASGRSTPPTELGEVGASDERIRKIVVDDQQRKIPQDRLPDFSSHISQDSIDP